MSAAAEAAAVISYADYIFKYYLPMSLRMLLERASGVSPSWFEAIVFYYGFTKERPKPTLDETGQRFGPVTRERIRQVKNKFVEESKSILDSEFSKINRVIPDSRHLDADDVKTNLSSIGIVLDTADIRGFHRLLTDYGYLQGYTVCDTDLNEVSDRELRAEDRLFLISESLQGAGRDLLMRWKKAPGSKGIISINSFSAPPGLAHGEIKFLLDLLRKGEGFDSFIVDGTEYFLIEGRDNALVNRIEVVAGAVRRANVHELSSALANSLADRSKGLSAEIIEAYLRRSKLVTIEDEMVSFNIQGSPLQGLSEFVYRLMKDGETRDFLSIESEIGKLTSFERVTLDKAVRGSPFLFADKSAGRKSYTFRILGESKRESDPDQERYQRFKRRLAVLVESGSDVASEEFRRREQGVLGEYLFGGKAYEHCAICGKMFSVTSLVAAHKKKRSKCSETERSDPNIVMPLCKFGCDWVYEERFIRINGGVVEFGDLEKLQKLGSFESDYVKSLVGVELEKKWIEGSLDYFVAERLMF